MAHPNKHIRKAIRYAEQNGWRFEKSGGQAHAYGRLYCPLKGRSGCQETVYSTPRNPENHAKRLVAAVDACHHRPEEDT